MLFVWFTGSQRRAGQMENKKISPLLLLLLMLQVWAGFYLFGSLLNGDLRPWYWELGSQMVFSIGYLVSLIFYVVLIYNDLNKKL